MSFYTYVHLFTRYSKHILVVCTDYRHTMAKSLIICRPNSNPNPIYIFGIYCTVPKWVLIVWPKIFQMPQNLSVQFVCPSPKVLDFNEKKASLGVRSPCRRKMRQELARTTQVNLFTYFPSLTSTPLALADAM